MYDDLIISSAALGYMSLVLAAAGVVLRKKIMPIGVGAIVMLSFVTCMGLPVCVLMFISHEAASGDWSSVLDTIETWIDLVAGISVASAVLNGITIFTITKRLQNN